MVPKISVIIPVYNAEKYLKECLDSLLGQTFTEFEIICVDDGSIDRSLEILKKYAEQDSRIRVLTQQNKYAGAARNKGFEVAAGEYVFFLDADDFFAPELMERTWKRAKETDADVVMFEAIQLWGDHDAIYYEKYPTYIEYNKFPDKEVFSGDDIPDEIFTTTVAAPWTRIVRADFLRKNHIYFQEIHNENDLYYSIMMLALAERISYLKDRLVYYRRGHGNNIQSFLDKDPFCPIEALEQAYDDLNRLGIYEKYTKSFIKRSFRSLNLHMNRFKQDETLYEFCKELEKDHFKRMGLTEYGPEYYKKTTLYPRFSGIPNYLKAYEMIHRDFNVEPELLHKATCENPVVTVVIPVYNSEKYLEKCLDSVLSQPLGSVEIICIDDCSSDGSLDVLMNFAKKESRISVYSNRENMGVSYNRNIGIQNASGRYVVFLDSDDSLTEDVLGKLVAEADKEKLDVLYCSGIMEVSETLEDRKGYNNDNMYKRASVSPDVMPGVDLMTALQKNVEYFPSCLPALYNRKYLMDNKLSFLNGCLHEDNAFTFQCMIRAERVAVAPVYIYIRYLREDSIVTSPVAFDNVYGLFRSYLEIQKDISKADLDENQQWAANSISKAVLTQARKQGAELSDQELSAWRALPRGQQPLFVSLIMEPAQNEKKINNLTDKNKGLQKQLKDIRTSITYRIAKKITSIIRKVIPKK